jgi:hypothetical protein
MDRAETKRTAGGAAFMKGLALPWEQGIIECGGGRSVTDEVIFYLADGGSIQVQETRRASRIGALLAAAPDLLEALRLSQSALAMMIAPNAIQQTTVVNAFAAATAAEVAARSAIAKAEGRVKHADATKESPHV